MGNAITLPELNHKVEKVEKKMKKKLVDWMKEKRDLYFMMGTHNRWGTWLIVSILYPSQRKAKRLDQFVV